MNTTTLTTLPPLAWQSPRRPRPVRAVLAALAAALLLMAGPRVAVAADDGLGAAAPADAHEAELSAAFEQARASSQHGPAEIKLGEQAVLKLPDGYVWIPEPAAGRIMRAMGNRPSPRELGLVFPTGKGQGWWAVAEFEPAGYIKDDDAKNWDVDEMLSGIKEGTEAANEERRRNGYTELDIIGWVEKPAYDAAAHRLVWSISARDKGAAPSDAQTINYNTYALGREGYVNLNLITDTQTIAQDKAHAHTLLAALNFVDGKRYADFNESTDKVAEYGLAALVGGFAAKKLGLLAVAAAFFAKFAKVILVGVAAVGAIVVRLFKRKNTA